MFLHFCRRTHASFFLSVIFQVVHEIRNYPYPQLHLLALQSLNPSRHASAVRESYEVRAATSSLSLLSRHTSPHSFIIVSSVTNALDMLECVTDFLISNYSGFQMPQMGQLPLISWHLFSFVTRCSCVLRGFFLFLEGPIILFDQRIPHLYILWIEYFIIHLLC